MTDPEVLLARLWAADAPPSRDAGFVIEVMERAERRRFALGVAGLVPAAVAAGAMLWAAAPMISAASGAALAALATPAAAATAAALVMAGWLWVWVSGRMEPLVA